MKLHVGCGPAYIPGWYNVDLREDYKTDYCGSIFDLEIEDNSCSVIWSCHFLEHLEYPAEVVKCLELMYKWIEPEGLFRIAVPDMEKVVGYYIHRDSRLFQLPGSDDPTRWHKSDSRAERLLFFMRHWGHTVVFDFDLLKSLLLDAGFRRPKRWEFGRTKKGTWPFDRYEIESLYVEADK